MKKSEIRDIIITTIRSYKRPATECGLGDLFMFDELFEIINRENVSLTANQWEQLHTEATASFVASVNMIHSANYKKETIQQLTAKGFHPVVINWILKYTGKIYFYVDEMTEQFYNEYPYANWRMVQNLTLFMMFHERYHTCQQAKDIIAQYEGVNSSNMAAIHDTLACEQEANEWALFQLTNYCNL